MFFVYCYQKLSLKMDKLTKSDYFGSLSKQTKVRHLEKIRIIDVDPYTIKLINDFQDVPKITYLDIVSYFVFEPFLNEVLTRERT